MEAQIAAMRLKIDRPDLLIRPRVGHVHFMEFYLAEETIAEGYRAAREALERSGRTGGGRDEASHENPGHV
jgi:NTE family protein